MARNVSQPTGHEDPSYRQIVDLLPQPIYVLRLDPEEYLYVNPAFERLLGVRFADIRHERQRLLEDVHPDDLDRMSLQRRVERTPDEPFTIRFRGGDGWRTLQLHEHIVRDEHARAIALEGMVADVTEDAEHTRRLETSLEIEREANAALTRLRQMQATFLQAVSHELRTPLAVITGAATTLERHHERLDGPQQADLRRRLLVNATRLERLLSDLLDVDRLTRDVIRPNRNWVQLGQIVHRTVRDLQVETHEIHPPYNEVSAYVDAAQFERIVENLVANALRHTPEGSNVWIAIESTPSGALLVVEDDGPGLPEHVDVFEPFVKGENAGTTPGTGLGLELVRRFAQLHDGTAHARPRAGGGTRFEVTFSGEESDP